LAARKKNNNENNSYLQLALPSAFLMHFALFSHGLGEQDTKPEKIVALLITLNFGQGKD
jgi:hypothetical protein